ncbi:uncharacterized protein jvl isoform X3 [Diabrotica undecimpunctata]|uniref:uncharacterized protein jvl isoform X3 n=1 Tax=Diabrotica undecimpunctata TaxID=50387 RepID=UPI003B63AAC3
MSSSNYLNEDTPFLYNRGGDPVGSGGMDCLQLRQPAGPFHYLISEQAKSLVALQELQHEVGALLEFRDLVIETFPNLRSKMASSTPATMTSHHSNIPVSIRPGDWTPGIRVRKKIGSKDDRKKGGDTAVQDSGFSTETSSKETHSASSTALATSSSAAGAIETDEVEDELWNLLDIIHRKGTRLKDEAEVLQGTLREQAMHKDEQDGGGSFQQVIFSSSCPTSSTDVRKLRQERDLLLDRLAEMEAEVLAGRVHTSRLQEDLEHLLTTKHDLEEQLKAVVTQRGEVNSRIHDLHLQFVTKSGTVSPSESSKLRRDSTSSTTAISSHQRTSQNSVCDLDSVLSDKIPKVAVPDTKKIRAILKEHDSLVLQKHLLTSTVRNQLLEEQLESASSIEMELTERLNKFKEEYDELKFQLEDKTIELEGTRARIRLLEDLQKPLTKSSSPDIIPNLESTPPGRPPSRTEISTPSMKAMSPLIMNSMKAMTLNLQTDHSSSTESAHDQSTEKEKKDSSRTRRPSKIPLKSYTAPKPPGGKHSPAPSSTRSRSGDSPGRPHSAQSWRTKSESNKSEGNSLNSKSNSLSKSRNSSLVTTKDSLSGKLRSSESFQKLNGSHTFGRSVQKKNVGGTVVKKENSVSDKIQDSNLAKEKSPSQWILSSYSSDPGLDPDLEIAFPDSLDKNNYVQQSVTDSSTSFRFHTANTFMWNTGRARGDDEFYDSIDTNMASSMFHNGEDMAECDSLERQLSDFLGKN